MLCITHPAPSGHPSLEGSYADDGSLYQKPQKHHSCNTLTQISPSVNVDITYGAQPVDAPATCRNVERRGICGPIGTERSAN